MGRVGRLHARLLSLDGGEIVQGFGSASRIIPVVGAELERRRENGDSSYGTGSGSDRVQGSTWNETRNRESMARELNASIRSLSPAVLYLWLSPLQTEKAH